MPSTPTSSSLIEIALARLKMSGEILEKKSGEKGYTVFRVRSGSPRNRVKRNVKKVSKKSEENME